MKRRIKLLLGIALACLLCNSCMDDKYDIKEVGKSTLLFDQALGLPLLHSSVMTVRETLMRYLGGDKIGEYSDNLLYFKYENIKYPINASAFAVPSVSLDKTIQATDPLWVTSGGTSTYTYTELAVFPGFGSDVQLDSITMNLVVHSLLIDESNFACAGTKKVSIQIDNLKKNGVGYALNNVSFSTGATNPIPGYTLQFLSGNRFNIKYIVTVTGVYSGQLKLTNRFETLGSSSLDYKYICGYLGKKTLYNSTMKVPINLFKDVKGMTFEDPKVEVEVVNSFGVPVSVSFTNLVAKGTSGNVTITMNPASDTSMTIAYPLNLNDSARTSRKELNSQNTNNTIRTAMNSQPSEFTYNIRATTNPAGTVAKGQFVKNDSKLDINFSVIFPLWGFCERYAIIDTVDFDYAELKGKAKEIGFKVWMNNGIPASGTLNMIFLDENNMPIDSITDVDTKSGTINILAAPEIANMKASGTKETTFWLNYSNLDNLDKIKRCSIRVRFKSAPDGKTDVKVYSTNTIQMKIGMRVQMAFTK